MLSRGRLHRQPWSQVLPQLTSLSAFIVVGLIAASALGAQPRGGESSVSGQSRVGSLAKASPAILVEIDAVAERFLDPVLTRRLIALELGESQLSEFVDAEGKRFPPTLFFRISTEPSLALVELWERGHLHGSRRVSLQGNPHLRARRIALTAAELGMRLRAHSLALIAYEVENRRAAQQRWQAQRAETRLSMPVLRAGAFGALAGESAWLMGARAELVLRLPENLGVDLAGTWAAGRAFEEGASAPLNWWEVSISPRYSAKLAKAWVGAVGFRVGAALADMNQAGGNRNVEWTARAAAEPALEWSGTPGLTLGLRPELGWLLRPVRWQSSGGGTPAELSGAWVGASVLATLGPSEH